MAIMQSKKVLGDKTLRKNKINKKCFIVVLNHSKIYSITKKVKNSAALKMNIKD